MLEPTWYLRRTGRQSGTEISIRRWLASEQSSRSRVQQCSSSSKGTFSWNFHCRPLARPVNIPESVQRLSYSTVAATDTENYDNNGYAHRYGDNGYFCVPAQIRSKPGYFAVSDLHASVLVWLGSIVKPS